MFCKPFKNISVINHTDIITINALSGYNEVLMIFMNDLQPERIWQLI